MKNTFINQVQLGLNWGTWKNYLKFIWIHFSSDYYHCFITIRALKLISFTTYFYDRFFVDGVPIRVFKNNKQIGVNYPVLPMYVAASLWNMTQWVGPVDWSKGPFVASYHGFDINGWLFSKFNLANCYSQTYEWNRQGNWQLNAEQLKAYKDIRKRYMTYDYCQSKTGTSFVECGANS